MDIREFRTGPEFLLNVDFRSQIGFWGRFSQIFIKYDRDLRPRGKQTYCRDETDQMQWVRDSDFFTKSTFDTLRIPN